MFAFLNDCRSTSKVILQWAATAAVSLEQWIDEHSYGFSLGLWWSHPKINQTIRGERESEWERTPVERVVMVSAKQKKFKLNQLSLLDWQTLEYGKPHSHVSAKHFSQKRNLIYLLQPSFCFVYFIFGTHLFHSSLVRLVVKGKSDAFNWSFHCLFSKLSNCAIRILVSLILSTIICISIIMESIWSQRYLCCAPG